MPGTGEGKHCLDSALELDRARARSLGQAPGGHHDADLACGAPAMVAAARAGRTAGAIFHRDQGGEDTQARFRSACGRLGATQSMGHPPQAMITTTEAATVRGEPRTTVNDQV